MPFFNESFANILQLWSTPIELVGLTLAVIEIKFTGLADRIELSVNKWGQLAWKKEEYFKKKNYKRLFRWIDLQILALYLFLEYLSFHNGGLPFPVWCKVLFILFTLRKYFFASIGKSIAFLDDWSKGRGLGAFGLILATLGFSMEVYQFILVLLS